MKIIKTRDTLLLTEKCLITFTRGELADGIGRHCADMVEDMLINSTEEMKGKKLSLHLRY